MIFNNDRLTAISDKIISNKKFKKWVKVGLCQTQEVTKDKQNIRVDKVSYTLDYLMCIMFLLQLFTYIFYAI